MFKRLFGVILFLLLATSLFPVEFGVKAGVNYFGFTGDIYDFKKELGFQGGFYANIPLSSMFSLQPELYFINNNTEYSEAGTGHYHLTIYFPWGYIIYTITYNYDYTNKFSMGWLNLPLLAKFTPVKNKSFALGILAGPYVAFNISRKITNVDHLDNENKTDITDDWKDDLKKLDFGAVVALNLEMLMEKIKLILDLRYTLGLLKLDKSENMKTNSIITAMIGIGF